LDKFDKKCDEGFLVGYSTTSKAYRVWNLASGTLEKVHDVEFNEIKGSQDEDENLDDVRGIQLSNAMKNMYVGDRPRQVIVEEDDNSQVLSNLNVQVDTNQASSSSQVQDNKWLVHHLYQVQAVFLFSNQPTIIHWTL
jgi:hypothetical protein